MKVLVIDDDPEIRETVKITFNLRWPEAEVIEAANGRSGIEKTLSELPHLVILDLLLPDIDGLEVCRRLRQLSNVPILMLTVKSKEMDKVRGLECGADDYLTKPFSILELLARSKALLRRASESFRIEARQPYEKGDLRIDFEGRKVYYRGNHVNLTNKEGEILYLLVRQAGQLVEKRTLLARVWGHNYIGETYLLKVYIRRLRQKLAGLGLNAPIIVNIPREGYKFIPPSPEAR